MLVQFLSTSELLFTVRALVRLFTSVCPLVELPLTSLSKALTAIVTFVRFLSCVCPSMPLQAVAVNKRFLALFACIRFLASMRTQVDLIAAHLCKPFRALITAVWFFIGMLEFVSCHSVFYFCNIRTVFASENFLCMRLGVNPQQRRCFKGFRAMLALVLFTSNIVFY